MFSLNKIKAAFNKKTEHVNDTDYTDRIINEVEGVPFALSETNVMYAGLSELAGFQYFKTVIIGTFKLKTINGATLILKTQNGLLELKSDMVELESEMDKNSNRHITRIDFEIDAEDVPKISRPQIDGLELKAKKQHINFSVLEIADQKADEEEE